MVFHLQPKLNRLFAVKNFELRRTKGEGKDVGCWVSGIGGGAQMTNTSQVIDMAAAFRSTRVTLSALSSPRT